MKEIVSILMIGISLSMDTFSLSLSLGSIINSKKIKILPLIVGLFHFFMPLLGNIFGLKLVSWFNLASHVLLGLILIFLGINLAIHYFKDENIEINLSLLGFFIFAFGVSIDSFTVGLGISAITHNYLKASIIFALCSAAFTYLGILIGKYSSRMIGKKATLLGIVILLILGIYHLF